MKNVNLYCLMAILSTIGNSRHYAGIYIEKILRTRAGPVLDRRCFNAVNVTTPAPLSFSKHAGWAVRHLADVVRSGPAPAHAPGVNPTREQITSAQRQYDLKCRNFILHAYSAVVILFAG